MGWLPSNNTCSTLSSQSALSTSSRGFVAPEMGVEEGLGAQRWRAGQWVSGWKRGAVRCSVHPRKLVMSTSLCRKQAGSSGGESWGGIPPLTLVSAKEPHTSSEGM